MSASYLLRGQNRPVLARVFHGAEPEARLYSSVWDVQFPLRDQGEKIMAIKQEETLGYRCLRVD